MPGVQQSVRQAKVFMLKIIIIVGTISVNKEISGTADSYIENKQDDVIQGCCFRLEDQGKPA